MPFSLARHKSRLATTTMAVLLWAMAGCGSSTPQIVGKWQASGGDPKASVWEFSTDNSVLIGKARGKYIISDNNRVKIQTPYGTGMYHMEFWGDHMILKELNGAKLEFDRIK